MLTAEQTMGLRVMDEWVTILDGSRGSWVSAC